LFSHPSLPPSLPPSLFQQVKLHTGTARKEGFSVNALREINILLALRHPNIVGVREMVVGSSLDKVYMVMDYFDNDLKVRPPSLPPSLPPCHMRLRESSSHLPLPPSLPPS